jgi:hypothetical protein
MYIAHVLYAREGCEQSELECARDAVRRRRRRRARHASIAKAIRDSIRNIQVLPFLLSPRRCASHIALKNRNTHGRRRGSLVLSVDSMRPAGRPPPADTAHRTAAGEPALVVVGIASARDGDVQPASPRRQHPQCHSFPPQSFDQVKVLKLGLLAGRG